MNLKSIYFFNMEKIFQACILGIVCIGLKYLTLSINCLLLKSSESLKNNDYKIDLIVFLTLATIFYVSLLLVTRVSSDLDSFTLIMATSGMAIVVPTVYFIIVPVFYALKSLFKPATNVENNLPISRLLFISGKYKILIIEKKITNAFATGVLPFTKVVLLGRDLINSFSDLELEAIVSHEVGHLKYNHLGKLYIVNILWTLLVVFIFQALVTPLLGDSRIFVLLVGLYYGIFLGAGLLIISGQFQKMYEKEADGYATTWVGKEAFIQMLISLNAISKGRMEKWSWNYPTLNERIDYVKNL